MDIRHKEKIDDLVKNCLQNLSRLTGDNIEARQKVIVWTYLNTAYELGMKEETMISWLMDEEFFKLIKDDIFATTIREKDDPIARDSKGGFYFLSQSFCGVSGPYSTEADAREALRKYTKTTLETAKEKQ